ncbi:mRNA decay activator protein ZFP36 [Hippocampus zosterae]|uniref:mRNA decay activator protein ZFP36 n=1 Tax=Hippocampus zosterae TaxID=109293 RepID=UPI00223E24E3|nr:mRNA decay activator protein ZFP36 [Hippocampus zosterae]
MPSDFLTPFLEVDLEFCKTFAGPEVTAAASPRPALGDGGFRRRHSLCPIALLHSNFSEGEAESSSEWKREGRLPRSQLGHIPFRTDRSVSMIEGGVGAGQGEPAPARLPPGLCVGKRSCGPPPSPPGLSARYKTELCRTFEESGLCKYGAKCQFAHGPEELRGLSRHPKYKTEPCRTFHAAGFCPYGARCHFVHNAEELLRSEPRPPPLRHSLSFAGFAAAQRSKAPSSPPSARPWSASPSGSPRLLSPLFPEPGLLRPRPYRPRAAAELAGEGDNADDDSALVFSAAADYMDSPPGFFAMAADDADSGLGFIAADDGRSAAASALCFPGGGTPRPDLASERRGPPETSAARPGPPGLRRRSSADSLSEEDYASSRSLGSASGGGESPGAEGRRLPIFSRLSVAADESGPRLSAHVLPKELCCR